MRKSEPPSHGKPLRVALAPLSLAAVLLAGCVGSTTLEPTRGYILISLDTLGARHLGAYGAERDTSPFFDRLAERATLFENAFVQYPSTLVSHASMFTGLYPREHGVRLPGERLSPELETLPERFRAAGFVTAAVTEGGFVSAAHGFDRGFEEFHERTEVSPDDEIERTFRRGLDFLAGLAADERFFLFLHTYSVHDPYEPPEPWRSMYLDEPASELPDSSGKFLRDVYMGRATVSETEIGRLRALYDGSVRYVDSVLEGFFAELETLGVADEVTVVVTSDHGEEFLQHGSLGHYQVYPETLHVPLLVVHPGQKKGTRVAAVAGSIDLAPTLFDLAGLVDVELGSGRSLAPVIGDGGDGGDGEVGAVGELAEREMFAEVFDQRSQLAVIHRRGGALFQSLASRLVAEPDGTWVTRSVTFDLAPGEAIEAVSFAETREVEVTVDGEPWGTVEVGDGWTSIAVEPAATYRRLKLATAECSVPLYLGMGNDSRCLSFKVRGTELRRAELFDLSVDPEARRDVTAARPDVARDLARRLEGRRWKLRAAPVGGELSPESVEALRALGYID